MCLMNLKNRLNAEIKATEETIKKIDEIIEQSKEGNVINKLVLEKFKDELSRL